MTEYACQVYILTDISNDMFYTTLWYVPTVGQHLNIRVDSLGEDIDLIEEMATITQDDGLYLVGEVLSVEVYTATDGMYLSVDIRPRRTYKKSLSEIAAQFKDYMEQYKTRVHEDVLKALGINQLRVISVASPKREPT